VTPGEGDARQTVNTQWSESRCKAPKPSHPGSPRSHPVGSTTIDDCGGWNVDWAFLISNLVTLASIVAAYYWYLKAKKEVLPRCAISDQLIIDSSDLPLEKEIEFAVSGVPVTQLRRCLLVFWNAGKLTLKGSDVVGAMSLEVPGVIGQIRVAASRDVCNPQASIIGGRIELTFSFLDRGDTILLSVLHDGPEADPKLQATIMGVPAGVKHSSGGYYIGRDRDEDAADTADDTEYEPPSNKKILARTAIFLLALAALLTKPLWDSSIPVEAVGKYAYFILIPLAIIAFLFLFLPILGLIVYKYIMAGQQYFPLAGLKATYEKLEKDAGRSGRDQSQRPAP
jgi:hypothetical protein